MVEAFWKYDAKTSVALVPQRSGESRVVLRGGAGSSRGEWVLEADKPVEQEGGVGKAAHDIVAEISARIDFQVRFCTIQCSPACGRPSLARHSGSSLPCNGSRRTVLPMTSGAFPVARALPPILLGGAAGGSCGWRTCLFPVPFCWYRSRLQ